MSKVETKTDEKEKEYKTKEYVRRANRNYRKKKYNEDENFRNHQKELSKLNYQQNKDKNKDKIREYKRNYMREYRAKKKAEKASTIVEQPLTTIEDAIKSLDIKN